MLLSCICYGDSKLMKQTSLIRKIFLMVKDIGTYLENMYRYSIVSWENIFYCLFFSFVVYELKQKSPLISIFWLVKV